MAKRGRPAKTKTVEPTVAVKVDHAKLLKQFEQEQQVQLEKLYKELAKIKQKVDLALGHVGFIDSAENLSQAAFKAGRAYGPLNQANDELEEILDDMYNYNYDNLAHWNDITNN
jgi:hypothetical protein